jgi:UDP-N-acetylglucosamine:LPS N-acetylglucosamine transferase
MKTKVQFFYLNTGNGHLAPAKAIAKNMASNYGNNIETDLVDGLRDSGRTVKAIIEDGYRKSINQAKWVFEFLYALHKIELIARLSALMVSYFTFKGVEKAILSEKPAKIAVLHFFMIRPVLKVIKKHKLNIPVTVIVTDPFTAHPIWFLDKKVSFVVFSEQLRLNAISKGIVQEKLHLFPFIIDESHEEKYSDAEIIQAKLELGFSASKKLILVIGGGDGIPKGAAIAESTRLITADAEVAFVCGRNEKLHEKVSRVKAKYKLDNLKVFGYVDYVHRLISISDIVVTKCGASTFMEILMANKVPVISNYIWEQEKGNMEYVCRNKMGVYEKKVSKLPELIDQFLLNKQIYGSFVDNITGQNIRSGTADVARFLAGA